MEKRLLEKAEERIILFDGAMGTMLMAAGLERGQVPESWNMERPDVVREIHSRYFDAGSDVVHTNTFGGNPLKLSERGLKEWMVEINLAAVRIAREACPGGRFVAGDMGPTGRIMKPLGDLSPEEAEEVFRQQAEALVEGGVDLISIETMFSLEEALAALRGAKSVVGGIPVCAAVTFTRTKNGFFTMMGEGVPQCVEALEAEGADIIGSNCTLGSRDMIALTAEMRAATKKPLLIQPNAGKPVMREGVTLYEQSPEEFARDGKKIKEAGAEMIGGCCGTNETFIRALADILF